MFPFGRRCYLCAEFYGQNDTSIMESVVLRPRGLKRSRSPLQGHRKKMDRYGHRKEIGREDERQRWVVGKMVMVKNENG